jgi:hypothetical protein
LDIFCTCLSEGWGSPGQTGSEALISSEISYIFDIENRILLNYKFYCNGVVAAVMVGSGRLLISCGSDSFQGSVYQRK